MGKGDGKECHPFVEQANEKIVFSLIIVCAKKFLPEVWVLFIVRWCLERVSDGIILCLQVITVSTSSLGILNFLYNYFQATNTNFLV